MGASDGTGGTVRRDGYDEVLRDGLAAACLLVGVLLTAFAVWHPFALPGSTGTVMAGVAGGTAVLLVGTGLVLRRRSVPAGRAHLVGSALAVLVLTNCAVHYALTEQPYLTVNVLLVLVGTGVCLVDPRWVTGLLAGMSAGWLLVVLVASGPDAALAAVPNLALGAAVAVLANVVRVGTLRRLLDTQTELRALSQRDDLTGLLNRRGFLEAAQHRLDRGRQVRLWFVDVDGLKAVNDEHGHDVGDVLLVSVATALAEVFSGGVVARLSGDEFAVVEDHGSTGGETRARRALDARLATAARATGLPVAVSTGATTARPGQTLSDLLSAADAAMYVAKSARRTVRLPEPRSV